MISLMFRIALICGSCVELLGELYDINTVLTQGRTYGRSRGCFAGGNL